MKLCEIGRIYDPQHPTCRTCQVGCALKSISKPLNLPVESKTPASAGGSKGKQTKTEIEYGTRLSFEFQNCKIVPFGLTLRMANNHKYTPDFCVYPVDGKILLVEVKARGKDGFRQPSYQRAKLAFDQCRVEYSLFMYRWAEKCRGEWTVKDY